MKKRRNEETKKWRNVETIQRIWKAGRQDRWKDTTLRRNEETQKRRNEEVKKRRNDSKNLEGRQTGQMEGHHIVSVAATHSWPEVLKAARAVKHFGWSGFRAKELILDLVPTCSPQWILPCWAGLASRHQPMACSPSVFGRMTLKHNIGSQTNFWTYASKDTSTGIQSNCWKGSCLSMGWICTTFNAVASVRNLHPWCFHVVCCVFMLTLHHSSLTIYFEEAVSGLADGMEVSLCPHNEPPRLPIGHERVRMREAQSTT